MFKINYLFLIIYFIIILIIGYFSSRKESSEEYLIGGRKLTAWTIAFTIAASFIGGNTLVNFTGFVYRYGAAMMWAMLGTVFGFIAVIPLVKRMRKFTEKNRFYTISDYLTLRYGSHTGLIATLIIMVWFLLSLVVQFIAGAVVIQSISLISYIPAILLMGVIVLVYLFMGGFKAVVKTDIFQYILFVVLFIIIIFSISQGKNLQLSSFFRLSDVGFGKLFAFFIIAAGFVITAPELWQRVYAGKNKRETIKGLIITSGLFLIIAFCIGILGLTARVSFSGIEPGEAAILGLSQLLPPVLQGLGSVLFFAVIMSTIDTILFILASNFSRDIFHNFLNKEFNQVKLTKIGLFIFTALSVLIAILYRDILILGLSFISIGMSFAPVLIGSFYFNLKPNAVKLALISSLVSVFILLFLGIVRPETSIISLPVSFIFLLLGQIIFKAKNNPSHINFSE